MNRRTAVGVLGSLAFGTVLAARWPRASAQPLCTLTPEQIEGPIYPEWYEGRTPHVHLKLRVGAKAVTTQLYFPDEVTNAVYVRAPYDRHPGRDTTNATDRFLGPIAEKSLLMWTMTRDGDGHVAT